MVEAAMKASLMTVAPSGSEHGAPSEAAHAQEWALPTAYRLVGTKELATTASSAAAADPQLQSDDEEPLANRRSSSRRQRKRTLPQFDGAGDTSEGEGDSPMSRLVHRYLPPEPETSAEPPSAPMESSSAATGEVRPVLGAGAVAEVSTTHASTNDAFAELDELAGAAEYQGQCELKRQPTSLFYDAF